jgi:hypothetical protein
MKPEALFIVVYLVLATVLWAIFNPGILCDDSVEQLRQAQTGEITNWHPPLMSVVSRGVYLAGGSTGFIVYVQCLAGVLGLRGFLLALACRIRRRLHPGWAEQIASLAASLILLAFTPLPFYLVTFLKDTWLCILLLWLGRTVLLIAARGRSSLPDLILVTLLMLLACLTRHNAVLLLLTFCPMLYILAARWRPAWPVLLVAGLVGANWGMTKALRVQDSRLPSQIMMLDMMGMATLDTSVLGEMPYLASNIRDRDFATHYRFGGAGCLLLILDNDRAVWKDGDALAREYRQMVLHHPILWLQTKLRAFHTLLRLDEVQDYFMSGIQAAGRRFPQNPQYVGIRAAMEARYRRVQAWSLARGFQSHEFWLTVGYALVLWGIHRRWDLLTLLCVLTPVLYGTSFALTTAGIDYRYLYPATLPIQGAVTVCACLAIMERLARSTRRLPGRRDPASEPCAAEAGSRLAPRMEETVEPGTLLARWADSLRRAPLLAAVFALAAVFVWWARLFPPALIVPAGGPVDPNVAPSQGMSPASFASLKDSVVRSGVPFCFPPSSPSTDVALRDDQPDTICFSADSWDDTFMGVTYDQAVAVKAITLRLHRPPDGLRIRDICIMASDDTRPANMVAHFVRSRINQSGPYTGTFTLPDVFRDGAFVVIDIDVTDTEWRAYRSWGVCCLSTSQGARRNYAPEDDHVISLRDITMHTNSVSAY